MKEQKHWNTSNTCVNRFSDIGPNQYNTKLINV